MFVASWEKKNRNQSICFAVAFERGDKVDEVHAEIFFAILLWHDSGFCISEC
jgi:hypothetical protein